LYQLKSWAFVDSVRLERRIAGDGWRVVAGPVDDTVTLGYAVPAYGPTGKRAGRPAMTREMVTSPGRSTKTRSDAVALAVERHLARQ